MVVANGVSGAVSTSAASMLRGSAGRGGTCVAEAVPLVASKSVLVVGGSSPNPWRAPNTRGGDSSRPSDVTERSRPNSSRKRSVECEAEPLPLPVVGEPCWRSKTAFLCLAAASRSLQEVPSPSLQAPRAASWAALSAGIAWEAVRTAPTVAGGNLAAGETPAVGGEGSRRGASLLANCGGWEAPWGSGAAVGTCASTAACNSRGCAVEELCWRGRHLCDGRRQTAEPFVKASMNEGPQTFFR